MPASCLTLVLPSIVLARWQTGVRVRPFQYTQAAAQDVWYADAIRGDEDATAVYWDEDDTTTDDYLENVANQVDVEEATTQARKCLSFGKRGGAAPYQTNFPYPVSYV